MEWFPRPRSLDALDVVGRCRHDAAALRDLLLDPQGELWRDRVGVVGSRDGSAKPTTRLLCAQGLVFKTDVARSFGRRREAVAEVHKLRSAASRWGLWHPEKDWFALAVDDGWLVVSVCPVLRTLRRLELLDQRLASWRDLACFALDAWTRHGVGLDLNPANFGLDAQGRLHYIDDEWYDVLFFRDIGEFFVGRIPEEDLSDAQCRELGTTVARVLRTQGASRADLVALAEGIEGYPVIARWTGARRALAAGVRSAVRGERASTRHDAPVCILADIHGNLDALDAVLKAVQGIGVEHYLVLGDFVGYGPHPAECIERIAALRSKQVIRGNHDEALASQRLDTGLNRHARLSLEWSLSQVSAEQRRWLGDLPLELNGDGWCAVHGAPRDSEKLRAYVYELTFRENLDYLTREGIQVCFYGHTHVPFVHEAYAGRYAKLRARTTTLFTPDRAHLVNPGSVGQPRDGDPRAAFALWDRREARVTFHRAEYCVERTVAAMRRAGLPEDLSNRLRIGR